ncbi:sigma-70 family RNA polymerase sigma factor [Gryllotalpicola protaetiae]|uniref:Sigma-70 family RNA polymerase sigma factor n=1 Tax=Gryllotalpicola protaetiae TaxID=2419771 RepID=A0A387C2P5_9MICO|nr:sigma-70 family RNA polymerase sigma factor [Gryllotalpicola protaetiae]AYG04801.1 sigma-70 family RNA polymerase sigma factor [Gryllotalpicola protaetiae]
MRQADGGDELSGLVSRAQAGDAAAVSDVIRQVRGRIFRYAMARIGTREEAEDVTQETCVALTEALPRFDGDSGRFTSFVFGIASHKVLMSQRARGRRPEVAVADIPDVGSTVPGPLEQAERDDALRGLLAHLDGLPDRHRDVLLLRVVAELSAEEVGEALGTTAANVRVIQHRALASLRAGLGGAPGTDSTAKGA